MSHREALCGCLLKIFLRVITEGQEVSNLLKVHKLEENYELKVVFCPLNLLILSEFSGFSWKDNESSGRYPSKVTSETLIEGVTVYPHGCRPFS